MGINVTSKAFAARFVQSCDDSPAIPPMGRGRQTYIADQMGVSQEAVRKWFTGEAMPKNEKGKKLAELLGVEYAWLMLGEKPELDRNEKLSALRTSDAGVNIVSGILRLRGARLSAPAPNDPRKDITDFCATIRDTTYNIRVVSGREIAAGSYELIVPRDFAIVRCVGFLPDSVTLFRAIELPTDMIEQHKVRTSGDFSLTIDFVNGKFVSGSDEWPDFNPLGGA